MTNSSASAAPNATQSSIEIEQKEFIPKYHRKNRQSAKKTLVNIPNA